MSLGFRRGRHGIEIRLSRTEAVVLRQAAGQLDELLAADLPEPSSDPLETLVGIAAGELPRPEDPVLARLLPDAYVDDEEAAGEFRRFTEMDLRTGKRAALQALVSSLPVDGGRVVLDDSTAQSWLGALNDLRLALGTRLGVTEELYDELEEALRRLAVTDPRRAQLAFYEWLGQLEDTLVHALAGW